VRTVLPGSEEGGSLLPKRLSVKSLRTIILIGCLLASGCSVLPEMSRQPTFHNPFPQLSKVAVAPFFNLSNEPTVDGRRVAIAYFNALQEIPGFEVVPVGVVEGAMREYGIPLRGAADARRLAQILDVDVVIVGAVTDYYAYYPPRMALQVEWYAANPGFHPIPAGYGLPWGTSEEEQIPAPLVFESEFALAKAQMATQTPPYDKLPLEPPANAQSTAKDAANGDPQKPDGNEHRRVPQQGPASGGGKGGAKQTQYVEPVPHGTPLVGDPTETAPPGFPPDWPDPRGFIPPPPRAAPPKAKPSDAPVIRHTRTYNGHDAEVTEALSSYYSFRNDARFGGWQGYLQRSDDFIRFCCHMHVTETLTARGGAGESRLVWRWPTIR
jgi:hypothetical protein